MNLEDEHPIQRDRREDPSLDKCANCDGEWHDRIVPADSRDIADLRNVRLCSTVDGIIIHHLEFED